MGMNRLNRVLSTALLGTGLLPYCIWLMLAVLHYFKLRCNRTLSGSVFNKLIALMYTFLRPLFLWFVKKQTQNILGEKVQTCLMYFEREEHRDNLNTAVFLAVMILDSKSVCRTSGSKPVPDITRSCLLPKS